MRQKSEERDLWQNNKWVQFKDYTETLFLFCFSGCFRAISSPLDAIMTFSSYGFRFIWSYSTVLTETGGVKTKLSAALLRLLGSLCIVSVGLPVSKTLKPESIPADLHANDFSDELRRQKKKMRRRRKWRRREQRERGKSNQSQQRILYIQSHQEEEDRRKKSSFASNKIHSICEEIEEYKVSEFDVLSRRIKKRKSVDPSWWSVLFYDHALVYLGWGGTCSQKQIIPADKKPPNHFHARG